MKKNRYPFPVANRGSVVVTAPSFVSALSRILELYPNRFVNTKFAKNVEQYLIRLNEKECVKVTIRNGHTSGSLIEDNDRLEELTPKIKTKLKHKLFMDLISAKKEAAKKSANNNGKAIYINVDEEGECLLMPQADTTTFAAFRGGHEVAVPIAPQLTKQISKHKPTKKMRPDEEELPEELDLPQGVELPKELKPKKGKAKRAAKVVSMTAIEPEEETPTEDTAIEERSTKRPAKRKTAKSLTTKKLTKKGNLKPVRRSEDSEETAKSVRTQGGKVERKAKEGTKTRQKRSLNLAPKNKPSALDVEQAKKTLAAWKKERLQEENERPKKVAKKPLKKVAKKLPVKKKK